MLHGRTLSYSDTQRYRVGPNYLQLPINRPKTHVATNLRDGQMTYHVDGFSAGGNPHVNYEPSVLGGLKPAIPIGTAHSPHDAANLVRQPISRTDDYRQAGDRFRTFERWEREELIRNLVDALKDCLPEIQQRMVGHFTLADECYGRRVVQGLEMATRASDSDNVGTAPTDPTANAPR